jgi:hypothetical protein
MTDEPKKKTQIWYKGMPSPNPGGRKRVNIGVRELVSKECGEAAHQLRELLVKEKLTGSDKIRLAVIQEIFDRAVGRPPLGIQVRDITETSHPLMDFLPLGKKEKGAGPMRNALERAYGEYQREQEKERQQRNNDGSVDLVRIEPPSESEPEK